MISFKNFITEQIYKDIVVTIPKSEYKNDDLETDKMNTEENTYQFWTLKRLPKGIEIGSKIYFVKHNKIESCMTIFKIDYKSEKCTTTDRIWEGYILYLKKLQYIKEYIPCKGFQGYRYKWWE